MLLMANSGPWWKSASWMAIRSGYRRGSCASRTTIRRRRGYARNNGPPGLARRSLFRGGLLDREERLHRVVHGLVPWRVMHRRHSSRAGRLERLVAVADDRILLVVLPLLEFVDRHVDVEFRVVGRRA